MDLAIETLLKLKKNRSFKKTSEALIHSDQGTHYTHPDYRQLDQLQSFGCERFYQEKITGSKKERPELEKMLDHLRSGDTVVICELTRLSRSTKDLFQLVELIEKNGANIKSLKETWLDTTTPQGKLMFTIFAGISQFERDLISQRTKEGLDSARARGRKGGRPPKNSNDIEKAIKLYRSKDYSLKEINEMTGISKTSLYRYLELQAREFKQKS
ncbi:DNA invertase Pin-like site-specific DNA recombinase [Paenibacillus brasilensis]|uniref:DNA invertase Pin-like site-specific DNA recombinase n=1 Tax=Paenibacillus brasilensis TaxID=128574 RepID=A0ABU0L7F6_9BACL|nr:DNA invertase Pin-like site-specific DNA recombinase [Paenibacillus brasilensis]